MGLLSRQSTKKVMEIGIGWDEERDQGVKTSGRAEAKQNEPQVELLREC